MKKLLFLTWFTRILAILAILFVLMFSLDAFGGDKPAGKQIIEFLIHNIPALILICALIVAWKYEIIGGAIFIIVAIGLGIFWGSFTGNSGSLMILAPFFLIGLLFILLGLLSRKSKITD
jgi:hypothetical protein